MAREKLVEKDIEWKQVYTDKTLFLKEQFEDVVGPGSYFRFEGVDKGSSSEYYCIIGPAKIHDPIAKFFAGVRKLPATYSAGGKYFDSLDAAASYARDTWGVPTPRSLRPYTASSLRDIKKKVDKWKDEREEHEGAEKESFSINDLNKTASDDYPVTELPDSDKGARYDQERALPENQKPMSSPKAQKSKSDEAIKDALSKSELEVINRYGKDIFDFAKSTYEGVNFEGSEFARDTGVGSQMGVLSWDDRGTAANTSDNTPTVLDLILLTPDIFEHNAQPDTLKQVPPAKGSKTSTWRVTVPGKGNVYLTQPAYKGYMNFLHSLREWEESGEDRWREDDRGAHEGETSSILGDPDNPHSALDGAGGMDSVEDIFKDLGIESSDNKRKKQVFAHTIKNLIKIAQEADDNGNHKHAEEIHKVIRKYKERIK